MTPLPARRPAHTPGSAATSRPAAATTCPPPTHPTPPAAPCPPAAATSGPAPGRWPPRGRRRTPHPAPRTRPARGRENRSPLPAVASRRRRPPGPALPGRCRGPPPRTALAAVPVRPSAPASNTAVSLCAVRLTPRSKLLTDRGDTPAAAASSSWVSFAPTRSRRSSPANESAGCSVTIAVPPHNLSATATGAGRNQSCPPTVRRPSRSRHSPPPQVGLHPAVSGHRNQALPEPAAESRKEWPARARADAGQSSPEPGVRILVGCFVGCPVGGHAW